MILALLLVVCPVVWPCRIHDSHTGKLIRSRQSLTCFAQSTKQKYPRKGYVVDHIKPLACGGCDVPMNMQWQTIIEGKAKDRIERKNCGGQ